MTTFELQTSYGGGGAVGIDWGGVTYAGVASIVAEEPPKYWLLMMYGG